MNDITPNAAPRKSHGTIIVILVILIILIAGIVVSMHQPTPPIAPAPEPTGQPTSQTPSPDAQVQNIDSLNSNLDNQQFEGTSDTMQ